MISVAYISSSFFLRGSERLKEFFRNNKIDVFVIAFLALFSPLFFYNLGGTSLVDFDEAWWAEVARNILVRKDPFVLFFNDSPIFFHPPFGYSLIALSQLIFGVGEFASRFPSALLGLGSVILTYLIGKNLFNRIVGVTGSLMLVSSVWFILRARSGNLDAIFVFMFLLTIYLFIKSQKNPLFLYMSAISFSLLFMTKTFIGVAVLVPIAAYQLLNLKKTRVNIFNLVLAIFLAVYMLIPWFFANYIIYGSSFMHSLFANAVKPGRQFLPDLLNLHETKTLFYLHSGIREWYYPAIIALIGSIFFIRRSPNILVLYAWIVPLLVAFSINKDTEIWHLLPLYPAIGLLIGFFLNEFLNYLLFNIKNIKFLKDFRKSLNLIGKSCVVLITLLLCTKQIYEFRNEVNLFGHSTTGLAFTAKAARYVDGELYLDNEHFLPSAVFYSQKKVIHMRSLESPRNILRGFVECAPRASLVITEDWRLKADEVLQSKYQELAKHQGYVLIRAGKPE